MGAWFSVTQGKPLKAPVCVPPFKFLTALLQPHPSVLLLLPRKPVHPGRYTEIFTGGEPGDQYVQVKSCHPKTENISIVAILLSHAQA